MDYLIGKIVIGVVTVLSLFGIGNNLGAALRVCTVAQGCTGTSTLPIAGQVLVGQSDGIYAPQATSTLGLGGSGSGYTNTTTSVAGLNSAITLSTTTTGNSFTIATSGQNIAFNFPLRIDRINNLATTTGGLIVASSSPNGWGILAVGTDGKSLVASSTAPAGVSWETVTGGSGTPGGSDRQLQFNNNTAFGGTGGLDYGAALNSLNFSTSSGARQSLVFQNNIQSRLNITGTSTGFTGNNSSRYPFYNFHVPVSDVAANNYVEFEGYAASSTGNRNFFDIYADRAGNAYLSVFSSSTNNLFFDTTGNSTHYSDGGMDYKLGGTFKVASSSAATHFAVLTNGRVGVGTSTPSANLHVHGDIMFTGSSTIVTPSLGGAALLAGQCSSVTSTISTAVSSSTAVFETTPQNYPGDGAFWFSYLSASGVMTTKVCDSVAGTPAATPYNVKIFR